MRRLVFCTIITPDYVHFASALRDSLARHTQGALSFSVLITSGQDVVAGLKEKHTDLRLFSVEDVLFDRLAEHIFEKYSDADADAFRWCMKPVFMRYLMSQAGFDNVVFLDPDLFFFAEYAFIPALLDEYDVLLSPHWRSSDPFKDPSGFALNFKDGVYNGGFIGASQQGQAALEYWATMCLFKCETDRAEGLFVDQKYLDILHSRFENVGVLRHKGCNLGRWNRLDCRRTRSSTGEVLINGMYPVVFIHFSRSTIDGIMSGKDPLLRPYLEEYRAALRQYKPDFDVIADAQSHFVPKRNANGQGTGSRHQQGFGELLRKTIRTKLNRK